MKSSASKDWDAGYEWKIVALLSLGFGLVGVDRFLIMPLFPVMMKDLGLDYRDMGYITGALSIAWGASAMLTGRLSDRIGHRKVIIPAMLVFSVLVGASGLAAGVGSLILIRACMGLAEGAYAPACITATLDASKPARHGLNIGLQQAAAPLLGLCLTPIVVTQMLRWIPWHAVFAIVSIPGLVLCYFTWRVLRDAPHQVNAMQVNEHITLPRAWREVLGIRNVRLNMLGMLCWITVLTVVGAFLPSYLVDYLHLDMAQMGFVLSATGIGGALGTVIMPAVSDRLGRRPVMVISVLGALLMFWLFDGTGPSEAPLFCYLLATIFFVFSLITLTVGPISAESAPPHLATTASGLVIGVGEIFGGGVAPALAGHVAKGFGIQYVPWLAIGALAVGLFVALALKETAPLRSGANVATTSP
ncbi:MFS transporter [Paraburkholderia sp. J63]|uniref:MFS transporter n=1 Tax=Paraburkholderia sp. J63 TaxID=2805434 RepID=UPI002ABD395B|nr:MFS transporter [Paraburkholderia sp. J63]